MRVRESGLVLVLRAKRGRGKGGQDAVIRVRDSEQKQDDGTDGASTFSR